MRFANTQALFLLIASLLALGLYWWGIKRKKAALARFGDPALILRGREQVSFGRQAGKGALVVIASIFITLSTARFQCGTHLESVKREGIDLIIAVDVSRSMLAEDLRPNRLARAVQEVREIIDSLRGDRIGLVAFAGDAFVQCPLTLDYGAAKLLLSVVNTDLIPLPGTNVASAIEKAIETFEQQERKNKFLILITDGESHTGDVEQFAQAAAREGIVVYTVGIGSPEGVPIPEFDPAGNRTGFKKDSEGQTIVTKLDELTLEKIALATNGKYYNATPEEAELDIIYDAISSGDKKELGSMQFTQFEDRFQYFLGIFIVIILWETLFTERRKVITEWKGRF